MVAVKEITWEEASAPDFEQTTRQAFRAAVDQVAMSAKAALPACASRVDKAVQIVLNGDVDLLPDGHARVASQCQGTTVYRIVNGTCDCPDFPMAPSSFGVFVYNRVMDRDRGWPISAVLQASREYDIRNGADPDVRDIHDDLILRVYQNATTPAHVYRQWFETQCMTTVHQSVPSANNYNTRY